MVTNNALNITATGIVKYDGVGSFTATTTTNHAVLIGSTSNAITNLGPTATAGQFLQSGGAAADPVFSTATLPSTATGTGKVLVADGTNWVASTPTFPNASATSGKIIQSDGTNWLASTPTYPLTAGSAGKILISDGTNVVSSTPTYPNVATGTGTILRANGTNWVASTSTYPDTNAVSTLLYASSANVMAALATANSGILATNSSGVPSITAASGNWLNTSRTAFMSYLNTAVLNVTGDGTTTYTVIFDTEVFDQANDFTLASSTFTAPVTGRYEIQYSCGITGGTVINSASSTIVSSNRNYTSPMSNGAGATGNCSTIMKVLADFDAADTATFTVITNDTGGKVDDVNGLVGGNLRTYVSGFLAC